MIFQVKPWSTFRLYSSPFIVFHFANVLKASQIDVYVRAQVKIYVTVKQEEVSETVKYILTMFTNV